MYCSTTNVTEVKNTFYLRYVFAWLSIHTWIPVSYTHLDVYKRQIQNYTESYKNKHNHKIISCLYQLGFYHANILVFLVCPAATLDNLAP